MVDWYVVTGMGMSMMSEVSFGWRRWLARWDQTSSSITPAIPANGASIGWTWRPPPVIPTALRTLGDGFSRPPLVDLTVEGLFESGIESDDEINELYYDPASDEWMEFDELFRTYLTSVVPGAPDRLRDCPRMRWRKDVYD